MTHTIPKSRTLSDLSLKAQLEFFGFREWLGPVDDPDWHGDCLPLRLMPDGLLDLMGSKQVRALNIIGIMLLPLHRLLDVPDGTPLIYIGNKYWDFAIKGQDALKPETRSGYLGYGIAERFHENILNVLKDTYLRRD